MWNRTLTDEEIAALAEDPYQLWTFRLTRWQRLVRWFKR